MQHRRNANGFANFCQTRPAIDFCTFRGKKPCLAAGDCRAPGGENDNIMLDEFFTDGDMPLIQRGPGVVSPNHAGYTPYPAVDDVVVEGIV